MDSPLDILSSAAAKMVNDKSVKLGNMRDITPRSSMEFDLPPGHISKRSLSTSVIVPDFELDEPLDMSLKSRNRNNILPEPIPKTKKFRPSVISFSGSEASAESCNDDRAADREGSMRDKSLESNKPMRQVIITHDEHEDGGLEEHFRRSLSKEYSVHDDSEGVDAHFSRALGAEAWKEIKQKSKITKHHSSKSRRSDTKHEED